MTLSEALPIIVSTVFSLAIMGEISVAMRRYHFIAMRERITAEVDTVWSYRHNRLYRAKFLARFHRSDLYIIVKESPICPEAPTYAEVYTMSGEYLGSAEEVC